MNIMAIQGDRWERRQKLAGSAVCLLLAGYVIYLITASYGSQLKVQKNTLMRMESDARKSADAVSIFFSERMSDLKELSTRRELSTCFESSVFAVSGMLSPQAGLTDLEEIFRQLLYGKTIGQTRIYSRIAFIDRGGSLLVNTESSDAGIREQSDWSRLLTPGKREPTLTAEAHQGVVQALISVPYLLKDKYQGQIVAWVPARTVSDEVLHEQGRHAAQLNKIIYGTSRDFIPPELPPARALQGLSGQMATPDRFSAGPEDKTSADMFIFQVPIAHTPYYLLAMLPITEMDERLSPRHWLVAMCGITLVILGCMVGYVRGRSRMLALSAHADMQRQINAQTAEFSASKELLNQEISERHLAGKALEEQLLFLQHLIDTIPSPIFYKDNALRYKGCNTAFENIALLAREKIIGKTIHDIFPEKQADFLLQKDIELLFRTGSLVYETVVTYADGSLHDMVVSTATYADTGGSVAGLVGVMTDITGRKQSDAERILLATVVEQAEENVLITDKQRTILYINPAFERSSNYACEELKGQKLVALRSDQHDETFYQTMKEILDCGDVWMGIIINKGKNGTDFEIEGTISPIRDTSGAITHYVAVGRNMSRFRKLERELQQVQKMDALGTLAGGIAHDFNNVLTAVMGLIEMELLGADDGSRTRRRMEQALASCLRARDLVKQILTFSRQSEQRRKPIEIGPIAEDAVKMLRAMLPSTLTIRFDLQAGRSVILGDPTQFHQILLNLCTNAAHAMRETGGLLEIALSEVEIDAIEASEHLNLQPGSYVRLTVRDTGQGMDRKTLDRIFEPFFTTKGPGEGAGVGLAVVHGIVKSHGGMITAQSELGKGSTFQVFFPKIENAVAQVDKPVLPFPTGNEQILFVDDEEVVADAASDMLKFLGYDVVAVNSSLEALRLLQLQPGRFHLVITDQTMPDMTGMELAAELLRIRPGLPILLCTGFASPGIWEKALAMGIRQVMNKPFVLQELARTVRSILDAKCDVSRLN
ncbi:MAG: PAS domain S-box protein [Deltaproteobacteria bacterium]|nr:PAS domain S-box protein [Deltaproteobacteria bacterium]